LKSAIVAFDVLKRGGLEGNGTPNLVLDGQPLIRAKIFFDMPLNFL
jgi:hypothetical protein